MKVKKTVMIIALTIVAGILAFACSDDLNVQRDYRFTVEHLPVPKRVGKGKTVEIRCRIVREGYYEGAEYSLRYFQTDGKGTLRIWDGEPLVPNDLYRIEEDEFRLYYTSQSEDQQTIDIYFFDNFDHSYMLSFSFTIETND